MPASVVPNGSVNPFADTEVTLPGLSSSREPASRSILPSGAFTVPPCTMVPATSASRPPAEYTSPGALPLLATVMLPPATGVAPGCSTTDTV